MRRSQGPRKRSLALVALAGAAALAIGATLPASSEAPKPILGSKHADHLVGTAGADRIDGRGGDDRIAGRGGADLLRGGAGFDRIHGNRGGDTLDGNRGGAVLVGGGGRDEFNARSGKPVGGQGRDVIRARDGHQDVVNCGPGHDVAYVDRAEDGVYGCERVVPPSSGQRHGGRR